MRAKSNSQAELDYGRIAAAISYLGRCSSPQPSLEEVAAHCHLSPYHFERMFIRWAGVSPKKYLQYLTKEKAKALLLDSASVLEAAYASGLSGPGRLHDLMIMSEGATPGQVKCRGEGLEIHFGVCSSPFGPCAIGWTAQGICGLHFLPRWDSRLARQLLEKDWSRAEFCEDAAVSKMGNKVFVYASGSRRLDLRVFVRGTTFQLAVWQALLKIPPGSVATYRAIAEVIGRPEAHRAVASAIGRNPVGYLIPCHRVLRGTGEISGYRWGPERKRVILARETVLSL